MRTILCILLLFSWLPLACSSHAQWRLQTTSGRRTTAWTLRGGAAAAKRHVVVVVPSSSSSNKNNKASSSTVAAVPIGTASIPAEIFNLIKSIVGAGVLGLPAGIAAFADAPSALIPATILVSSIGFLSAYSFFILGGLICGRTRSTSYRQAWSRTVGPQSSWMPAVACLLVTAGTVLTYSMILADTVPAILQALSSSSGSSSNNLTRTQALLGITLTTLLPLCLLPDLQSLAPFSLVGIVGMLYTGGMMMFRWWSGSYATITTDSDDNSLTASLADHLVPRFGNRGWRAAFSGKTAIFISMLSTAYMAHYNAPKFYWELRDNHTLSRFQCVVTWSFVGAVGLMLAVMAGGFGTFGAASSSMILNNYAVERDGLMSLARVAVTLSLICGYPLAFVGVREGVLDLVGVTQVPQRRALSTPLTVALLTLITALAFVVPDIGIILALGGATWGNCVIYLFPAVMLVRLAAQHPNDADLQRHVPRAVATGVVGLLLGVLGTGQALRRIAKS